MAEIEEALKTRLLANTALTALISTQVSIDFIPPKTALPCVVFLKVSDVKDHTLTRQLELEHPVFQVSAYAATKSAARSVANQIKVSLLDFSGVLSGITVQHIRLINEMSTAETSGDGTQKIFVEDLEFEVFFLRS